ncbi:hypothetical protein FZEAL_1106 [Fusarium zealandicum]|uniref:ATP synthase F(0) complex subunit e, mitochondrial n=1 Tax=Fusarium zealandicum TaxID=1053134 RepID=A0A8H4UTE2_9HYPO|nr:hypothetical protein FZEAL_1106 [Fusarium zealandicum]
MASTGVNVLRWSALGVGIFYGFTHQRAITSAQKAEHATHEYEKKEKLISQAKAEFAKKNNPTLASGDSGTCPPAQPPSPPLAPEQLREAFRISQADAPKRPQTNTGLVVTDPADPKFDLEKLLLKVAKESP